MARWWHRDNEVVKTWFDKRKQWDPLVGDLPFQFSSGTPASLDMALLEIILRSRGMWPIDEESCKLAIELYSHVPQFLPYGSLDDLPDPKFRILSICAIYYAWNGLKKLYSGKIREDTELWKIHDKAKSLFQDAITDFLFYRRHQKVKESNRKGGKKNKKEPAIYLLIRYARQKGQFKTGLQTWKFLKKECTPRGLRDGLTLKKIDFVCEQNTNTIAIYFPNGQSKNVRFRTFQRYLKDFKTLI
jgi:hypothetical protein